MPLDLTPAVGVFLALTVWLLVRRHRRAFRASGPLPAVPDASATSVPIEAPGLTPPDSSLDPTAPTRQPGQ